MTVKEIREKHQKEIDDFCKECPHESISDWLPYCWAPGHCAGHIKICNRCEIMIESKNDYNQFEITVTSNDTIN